MQETIGVEFDDLTAEIPAVSEMGDNSLPNAMASVDLIEDWCKAVRAETERRLLDSKPVTGWKLVEGKKGNRQWTDAAAAEQLLKTSFRLPTDDIYARSLVGIPAIEKLLKDQPKRWAKVKELITQKVGKPSVAPESDARAAWKPMEFDAVEEDLV